MSSHIFKGLFKFCEVTFTLSIQVKVILGSSSGVLVGIECELQQLTGLEEAGRAFLSKSSSLVYSLKNITWDSFSGGKMSN